MAGGAELEVSILSPARVVSKTPASQVQLPGTLGYMGILPGHTRFVGELGIGELTVDASAGKQVYFIAGGYVDVADDKVTVLVDVVEKPSDIDVGRAEKAKQRALDRLHNKAAVDLTRAQAALLRAETRLTVASRYK
jgi:F-type H+-transporting ATPase subunit epsilon